MDVGFPRYVFGGLPHWGQLGQKLWPDGSSWMAGEFSHIPVLCHPESAVSTALFGHPPLCH